MSASDAFECEPGGQKCPGRLVKVPPTGSERITFDDIICGPIPHQQLQHTRPVACICERSTISLRPDAGQRSMGPMWGNMVSTRLFAISEVPYMTA